MGFKEEFLKMQPGPARDAFVFNEAIKRGPPKLTIPITVDGPNGMKITYKTMSDVLSIDGLRITISPIMAQKLASHWGLYLPTSKQSKQIYEAADTKIRATPLSGVGYTGSDGKFYSGKDVANYRIGQSDAAIAYNDLTNQELAKVKNPRLIAGHGKDILEPINNPNDVSMGGWQGKDKSPIQPYTGAHKGEAHQHTEYALYTRLISGDVTVTLPNGKTITTTMEQLRKSPTLYQSVADNKSIQKYDYSKVKVPPIPKQEPKQEQKKQEPETFSPPAPAQQPRTSFMERLQQFLNELKI